MEFQRKAPLMNNELAHTSDYRADWSVLLTITSARSFPHLIERARWAAAWKEAPDNPGFSE
jgi:hypothetical protein